LGKQDADFHLGLAQATHNTIQTHIMSTSTIFSGNLWQRFLKDRSKVKKLLDHHQRIFNAIKNHAPDKAREKTLEHLSYVESEVKASTDHKE